MNRLVSTRNQLKTLLRISHITKSSTHANVQLGSARHMSDNLLGHNPMAGSVSTTKNTGNPKGKKPSGPMVGVDSNTEGGGVWAQTSAKRDKLGELKLALDWDKGQRTLDDAATDEEKLDLFLVDGVNAIGMLVDGKDVKNYGVEGSLLKESMEMSSLQEFFSLLDGFQQSLEGTSATEEVQIDKQQFDAHISHLIEEVEQIRRRHNASPQMPSDEETDNEATPKDSSLIKIRDIVPFEFPNENANGTEIVDPKEIPSRMEKDLFSPAAQNVRECAEYFRILLIQSILQDLSTKWDDIVKISDADLDRAATTGSHLEPSTTVSLEKIHNVLHAFAQGTCQDRVEALWKLADKDQDGLIDQVEMDQVVYMSIAPVEDALRVFVEDCIEVWPMRLPLRSPNAEVELGENLPQKGRYQLWKDAREEKKIKKKLLKFMDRAIKKHFEIDVEVPHRLRCSYAWAEKQHQDGKVESVLVESSGDGDDGSEDTKSSPTNTGGFLSGGRKRYVELDPKISYPEFRSVQKEHFPHLDRVAEELCISLKEELWIYQGTGRQNQEVKRESIAFLAVVSLIDYGIFLA